MKVSDYTYIQYINYNREVQKSSRRQKGQMRKGAFEQCSGSPSTLKSSGMKTGISRMTVTDCSAPRLLQQKKHSCTAWTAVHTHTQIAKIAPCAPLGERVRQCKASPSNQRL